MIVSSYTVFVSPHAVTPLLSPCCSSTSTDSDDTSGNQLLDLGADARVLHVLTEGGGVRLGLLQDGLHDRILHDAHDLQDVSSKVF